MTARQAAVAAALSATLAACSGNSTTSPTPQPQASVVSDVRIESSFVGGVTVEGTVTLNAPAAAAGVVVSLTTDNASLSVPGSITIAAGRTSGTFQVISTVVKRTTMATITARTADVTKSTTIRLRFDPATVSPTGNATITFGGAGVMRPPITKYEESGFVISPVLGDWVPVSTYGNPAPFIQFATAAGVTTHGEIRLTFDGAPFWLTSADFYSSTTPIPYVIEGLVAEQSVYTVAGTLGNTFGRFANVPNPRTDVPIDALVIRLTNAAAPCCSNPMGIDNIALRR